MPESKGRDKRASYTPPAKSKAQAPNPEWWVPVFVTLLLLGLAWIVVFYITQGAWPIGKFNYGNLVIGFALLLAGFGMAMRWR
ncbi:cell division protein CrgA [Lapillicoccus sp.]|uniref:cell division protein CrgA n=1 Tax=Lapillicoccus sp. TaxID=1909287 RepID=UPI003265AFDD